jgi:hypothetical protein
VSCEVGTDFCVMLLVRTGKWCGLRDHLTSFLRAQLGTFIYSQLQGMLGKIGNDTEGAGMALNKMPDTLN